MPDTLNTVRVTKRFRFALTEREYAERTKNLTDELAALATTKDAAKESAKAYREALELHAEKIADFRDAVASREEYRDVACEERYCLSSGSVITVRLDTDVEVSRRPMTTKERQLRMDF